MTIKDVNKLMHIIKQNYQEFSISDSKINEWFNELQEFSFEDVEKKLYEHLRSEKNSQFIPKVYILTKNLIKEKNKDRTKEIKLRCQNCGCKYDYNKFDWHLKRCNSIIYINEISKKYFGKEVNKDNYFKLNDIDFNNKYNKILMFVYEKTQNKKEKERLENYLIGNKNVKGQFDVEEFGGV